MITTHTPESLIAFENKVKVAWESGELPSLIHLAGGNEEKILQIFSHIRAQDWVFMSHRGHYAALLKGMSEEKLMEHIRADRSMFIFDRKLKLYQSAILSGCCGIAVGVALGAKQNGTDEWVYCFLGDGAEESGAFYEAVMYATGHDLPITFVVECNNRQVDTDIASRRGVYWGNFLMESPKVIRYSYIPTYPHAGSGCKTQITFQRTTPLPR
jgi:TPP-dependent pyruvate/acetoin dehydrogenase alpha subunit